MAYFESLNLRSTQNQLLTAHSVVMLFHGLYGIFLPVYLYTSGVPVVWIVSFEVGYWLFSYCMVLPNYWGFLRLRYGWSLVVSWVAQLLHLFLLATLGILLEQYPLILILVALAVSQRIAAGYYWLPFHTLFAVVTDGKHEGRALGYRMALGHLVTIITPLIGGVLLFTLEPVWFFGLISLGYTAGMALFYLVDFSAYSTPRALLVRNIWHQLWQRGALVYFTEGLIGRAQHYIWPLLLGVREISLVVMGGLFTGTNLLRTILSLAIGDSLDRHRGWTRFIQAAGMIITSASLFVRGLFTGLVTAGTGQAIGGLGQTLYAVPTKADMYRAADRHDAITPIAVRELMLNVGRTTISLFALVAVLLYSHTTGLNLVLLAVGVWCFVVGLCYVWSELRR